MQTTQNLKPFNIQRTCVYDGPGIRSTIFFQGCGLRCLWCQNPEGQAFHSDLTDNSHYSVDEILDIISRDRDYYQSTNGGITFSGGEPFMQDPDSMIDLIKLLKDDDLKITVETSLYAPWKNIEKVAPYIDLFLIDLKVVGDDNLHLKLTKQSSKLIHENVKKLIDLGANIKFRMVMVPGLNDKEANIIAAAEFLKSIKYDSIELLKYHNIYEGKAKRFGIEQKELNITPQEASESIERGLKVFRENGIKAENVDLDATRKQAYFTHRVKRVQNDIRESKRALCMESANLRTDFYKKHGFNKPVPIHRAESLSYILKNKKTIVYPDELIVGNFTSKRVAGHVWENYYGVLDIMFLYKLQFQRPVAFQTSFKERMAYYTKIFPFWQKNSLLGHVYPHPLTLLPMLSRSSELVAGFNNNMAAIAHFIPNYERVLAKGTTGIIEDIRKLQKERPENNQNFYEGAIIALKGVEAFAEKYAMHLSKLAEKEKDPIRREELEKMSKICSRVPKNPAQSFHEALQSIAFFHIALCIEQYENAISFGRLDQILYPYYKKDKEAGRITYEEAKELLCLFVLKMDEDILVNDGNSFLNMSKMFETLSTDQAVTLGGVDKDGNDVTNDLTYMLIDACELQTLSLDIGARVHENSPDEYLERLAQAYVNGSPLPQLFSDKEYIPSLLKHYPVSTEQARDYSIVGCVEPCASDDHFGNTDCANVNLALPLLQAMKGHDYDLWNYGLGEQLFNITLNFIEWVFKGKNRLSKAITRFCKKLRRIRKTKKGYYEYNTPSNMEDLIARFQERLNVVTNSILKDHQKIERELRRNFHTPLASSLYPGCLESGKDVYEGGTSINSSGIQAVGVTDVADSLYALNEVVYKKQLYTIEEVLRAIDTNFQGRKNQKIRKALMAVPKFGNDSSKEATEWVNKVLDIYNKALESVDGVPRNGRYSAGYYALNVNTRYGLKTPALPSGRLEGVPLANSITPHYGMEQKELLGSLNAMADVDFVEHCENGTTATLTIDSALFQGRDGIKNLASIFKTYLTTGGMMLQPNVISREILLEAYNDPKKHPYLLVRIAGYCAYFHELSEEMKLTIINRTCYT